jgi:hypothetical protein
MKIATMYSLHPMFVEGIARDPKFQLQIVALRYDRYTEKEKSTSPKWTHGKFPEVWHLSQRLTWTGDIAYCCPMLWLSKGDTNTVIHSGQFSISSYTKLSQDGRELFSMFLNIPHDWVETVIEAWFKGQQESSLHDMPMLLDHFNLLGSAV